MLLMRRGLATLPALARKAGDVASKPVKTTVKTANVKDALATLTGGKFGALVVANPSDGHSRSELHGVITERDFLSKMPTEGTRYSMFEPTVADLMTTASAVQFAQPDWTLSHCLEVMIDGGFRHLPIGELRGVEAMLSLRDIAKAVADAGDPAVGGARLTVGALALAATARRHSTVAGMELPASIAAVSRGATVTEAVLLMRERRVGSVLVPTCVPRHAPCLLRRLSQRGAACWVAAVARRWRSRGTVSPSSQSATFSSCSSTPLQSAPLRATSSTCPRA